MKKVLDLFSRRLWDFDFGGRRSSSYQIRSLFAGAANQRKDRGNDGNNSGSGSKENGTDIIEID